MPAHLVYSLSFYRTTPQMLIYTWCNLSQVSRRLDYWVFERIERSTSHAETLLTQLPSTCWHDREAGFSDFHSDIQPYHRIPQLRACKSKELSLIDNAAM